MKGLIFPAHIDLSVIPHVPDSAEGLPDSSFINEHGERDSEVLAIRMGLNRKMRRFLKSQRTSLVQRLTKREQRIRAFLSRMRVVIDQRAPIALQNDIYASWEAQALTRVLPGWEFIAEGSPEAGTFAALRDEDRDRLRGWYGDSIGFATVSARQEEHSDKTDGPSEKHLDKVAEYAFRPVVCALIALFDALDQWSEVTADRRVDLAEAAFAAFTLFGRNVLATCVMKTPALYDYYKHIRSESGENSPSLDVVAQAAQVRLPMSLDLLYAEILQIASRGKTDPSNVDFAVAIETLLASELPRLRLEKEQLGSEQARRVIDAAIELLQRIGTHYAPQYFQDGEFLKAFRSVWLLHFGDLLRQPTSSVLLEKSSIARARQVLSLTNVAEYGALTDRLQQCIDERTQLEVENTSADFRRRAAVRRTVTEVEERIARLRRELEEVGDVVVPSLLPDGVTLQALGEVQVVTFAASSFDPTSQTALRSFEQTIAQLSAQFDSGNPQASIDRGNFDAARNEDNTTQLDDAHAVLSPECGGGGLPPVEPRESEEISTATAQACARQSSEQPEALTGSKNVAASMDVKPSVVVDAPVHPLTDELQLDSLLANPNDARVRLLKCRDVLQRMPAPPAENIALLWLARGYPNFAAHALQVVSQVSWIEQALDGRYLQAAIRGMHVWRMDQSSITRVHKDMSVLTEDVVAECMERRPTGRVVPYLAFASAFQPTLFCGTLTSAHRLLESVATVFDGPAKRLIEELL